ncbi:GTP cyclohydrolase N terminal-domain-containing protein [Amanita rubescens]|nr:GTP cyclohydrolase N terminal-domain-containing protein [Amanita rubescens]
MNLKYEEVFSLPLPEKEKGSRASRKELNIIYYKFETHYDILYGQFESPALPSGSMVPRWGSDLTSESATTAMVQRQTEGSSTYQGSFIRAANILDLHLAPLRHPNGTSTFINATSVPSPTRLHSIYKHQDILIGSFPEILFQSLRVSSHKLDAYPNQHGIDPHPLNWGTQDPKTRGPVIYSRLSSSIKHRNTIGAQTGSYSIYRALSTVAMGALSPSHKPDYALTQLPVSISPQPSWYDKHKLRYQKEELVQSQRMYTTLAVERVDARDHTTVLEAYLRVVEVNLNVGALGENAVERYALILVLFKLGKDIFGDEGIRIEGVYGGDLIEEWRRALLRAREHEQDVSRVAVVAVERFVDKAFESDNNPTTRSHRRAKMSKNISTETK